MSELKDWSTKQIAERPWEKKCSCGFEDGAHEPDCEEHFVNRCHKRAPRVWNKYAGDAPANAVYIGRGVWSKFGNPFSHMSVHGTVKVATRAEAVAAYAIWLEQDPALIATVKRDLRGKDLVCWCAPAQCHGDILLKVANS